MICHDVLGGLPHDGAFCKVLIGFMGGSLLVAALLSDPDPTAILQGAFIPSLPQAHGLYSVLLILMALIAPKPGQQAI